MIALLVIALLAQTPHNRHTRENRRAGSRNSVAALGALEAFNSRGMGTFGDCSTTLPTGARGEVLGGFSRATVGACTKGIDGLRTTGIADGDIVPLAINAPRVERNSAGTPALLLEGVAATQLLTSQRLPCSAPWVDVGTPNCTAASTTGPWGTTTMSRFTDDAAGATEGRSQTVVTTSAVKYTAYCFVKGGTATSASLSMQGTGSATGDCSAQITGLSTTTSSILSCSSTAAYAGTLTAVFVGVVIGTQSSDQGTIFVEGCNLVPGTATVAYRTSFIDGASRAVEAAPNFPYTWAAGSKGCGAVTVQTNYVPVAGETWFAAPVGSGNPDMLGRFSGANSGCYMISGGDLAAGTWVSGSNRWLCSTARQSYLNGTSATGATNVLTSGGTMIGLGSTGGFGPPVTGLYSNLLFDPTSTFCTP